MNPSTSTFSPEHELSEALMMLSEASERKRKTFESDFSGHSSSDELHGSSDEESCEREMKKARLPSLVQMDINNLVNNSTPSEISKISPVTTYVSSSDSTNSNWMEKYNNLRKTINLAVYPSAEDVQWLNSQFEEMRNNLLSPERAELLKQAIHIITLNKQTPLRAPSAFPQAANFVKIPKSKTSSSPPSPPPRSPLGSPTAQRSPVSLVSFSPNSSNKKMKRNQLSSWMCTQRQDKKSGELPEYRIKLLDLAGFVWSKQHKQKQLQKKPEGTENPQVVEAEVLSSPYVLQLNGRAKRNHELWMVRFHELIAFKKRYGHLKVPTLIPDDE